MAQKAAKHGAAHYKRLFWWLPWPLRIVLVVATVAVGAFVGLLAFEVVVSLLIIGLVLAFFWRAIMGGRSGGSSWRADDAEYMQDMADAEQRQHEDEGRV